MAKENVSIPETNLPRYSTPSVTIVLYHPESGLRESYFQLCMSKFVKQTDKLKELVASDKSIDR